MSNPSPKEQMQEIQSAEPTEPKGEQNGDCVDSSVHFNTGDSPSLGTALSDKEIGDLEQCPSCGSRYECYFKWPNCHVLGKHDSWHSGVTESAPELPGKRSKVGTSAERRTGCMQALPGTDVCTILDAVARAALAEGSTTRQQARKTSESSSRTDESMVGAGVPASKSMVEQAGSKSLAEGSRTEKGE